MGAVGLCGARVWAKASELDCDVLVVGGGTGGFAAALAACRLGMRVVLTEETDWIGGQFDGSSCSAGRASLDRTLRPHA